MGGLQLECRDQPHRSETSSISPPFASTPSLLPEQTEEGWPGSGAHWLKPRPRLQPRLERHCLLHPHSRFSCGLGCAVTKGHKAHGQSEMTINPLCVTGGQSESQSLFSLSGLRRFGTPLRARRSSFDRNKTPFCPLIPCSA